MASKAVERTYYAPPYRVWDALRATITYLGYRDVIEDRGAGTILYRTGFSIATWRGQQMTAVVYDAGGSSVVSLEGQVAFPQLFGWGERKRLAKRVLDGAGQRLSA